MKMRSLVLAGAVVSAIGVIGLEGAAAANMADTGTTWAAACDSAMSCRLTSDPLPAEDGGITIPAFVRDIRAGSPVAMVLPTPDGFDKLSPKGSYKISVDGRTIASVGVDKLTRDPDQGGYVTSDPAVVTPVLDAAKAGKKTISVAYTGPEISEFAETDLDGFRKSLDWLNKQG